MINKREIMKYAWKLAKQIYKDLVSYSKSFFRRFLSRLYYRKDEIFDVKGLKPRDLLSYTLRIAWKKYKQYLF